jgi:hypothetical protein
MSWGVGLDVGSCHCRRSPRTARRSLLSVPKFRVRLNATRQFPISHQRGIGISFRQKYGFRETSAITWNSCPGQKITESCRSCCCPTGAKSGPSFPPSWGRLVARTSDEAHP